MQAHVVLAHPEPQSFNAHLARVARHTLEAQGWTVSMSDLYGIGFDPCERPEHYAARQQPARFDVQAEQRHASEGGSIPDAVAAEIETLDRADLLILQYPMWWHLPPAMLKGWFDPVLIYGAVYTSKVRFEAGRFVGKRAMLSVTVGTSEATYAFDGRSGDIDLLLWPVNFSLAYVGYSVLSPFIAYGVEAGLRYSDASVVEARLKRVEETLDARFRRLDQVPVIPFNRMAEWGTDGRIVPARRSIRPSSGVAGTSIWSRDLGARRAEAVQLDPVVTGAASSPAGTRDFTKPGTWEADWRTGRAPRPSRFVTSQSALDTAPERWWRSTTCPWISVTTNSSRCSVPPAAARRRCCGLSPASKR